MRSFKIVGVAVGLMVAIIGPMWSMALSAPTVQRSEPSSCSGFHRETGLSLQSRFITPNLILDCETADVSVTVGADCDAVPLHIVVDIDRSGSMIGRPIEEVKAAARTLVQALDMDDPKNETIQVGLVSHGDPANIDLYLTNRGGTVLGQINRMRAGGEDNLSDSIEKSHHVLRRARFGVDTTPFEIAVVLSDGGQTYPPQNAVPAAGRLKGDGVLVIGVCADNGTPGGCNAIRSISSGGRYYFQARGTSGLSRIFREIAVAVTEIELRSMYVEETLPEHLELVPDSIMPEPSDVITSGPTTIKWYFNFPKITETYGYRVRPQRIMTYPLAVTTATFRDSQDKMGKLVVPTAVLTVTGPCETPATPPTPTYTPEASPTWTPTPTTTPTNTPTATATPTPIPEPVYLPILGLSRCVPVDRPIDAVLVIDASTSMRLDTPKGRPKIEAAKDGAKAFVEMMRQVDRVAIVSFNSEAHVHSKLTGDRRALESAIDGIVTSPWTRIDLGLRAAAGELADNNAGAGHLPVIVLMSDGQPTETTEEEVLAAATEARRGSTQAFTIGVGGGVNQDLMRQIAGDPGRYYHADDAEALEDIYRRIALKIPCRDEWLDIPQKLGTRIIDGSARLPIGQPRPSLPTR